MKERMSIKVASLFKVTREEKFYWIIIELNRD